jgi:hypothetical protein
MQVRLLSMLDEYNYLRQEKDEEKRRLRVRNICFTTEHCQSVGAMPYSTLHCKSVYS